MVFGSRQHLAYPSNQQCPDAVLIFEDQTRQLRDFSNIRKRWEQNFTETLKLFAEFGSSRIIWCVRHDLPCVERVGPRGASTGRLGRAVRVAPQVWPDKRQPGQIKCTPSPAAKKGQANTARWNGSRLRRSRSLSSSLSILSTFRGGMRQSAASIREIPVRRRDSRQLV